MGRHESKPKEAPDESTAAAGREAAGSEPAGALVAIDALRNHPRNPRRGDVEQIKRSLLEHGQFRPLVVNQPTGEVLAGNHTLRAARELGWREIWVTYVSVDDERARRILLVDNRTNDLAGYDTEELLELLSEFDTLAGTAYDEQALDELLEAVAPKQSLLEDDVPSPPAAEPLTRPGELIRLGEHRLLCADARDPAAYERLLGSQPAAMLFTDPPYGVGYEGKTDARLSLANDDPAGLTTLLRAAFEAIDRFLEVGAPLYIARPAGAQGVVFLKAFLGRGWLLRQELVWDKRQLVLGHCDYHYRHELLIYGFKPGEGRLGRGGRGWYGSNSESSVIEVPRPAAAREHPTMKPPALVETCLRNSSRRRAVVLDPFAGSGSTLVACARLGRRARLIEIDPCYCDVIVERFESLTGERARRGEDEPWRGRRS